MALWRGEAMSSYASLLMRLEPVRRHFAVWSAARALEQQTPRASPRTADELAFLPAVVEIIETPASPMGRAVSLTICALFASALVWAYFGQVDIHATAQGRVIPGGKTKVVAASEVASVSAIHVQDGDHVTEGEVLVDLDQTSPEADSVRLLREELTFSVAAARLRALLDGRADLVLPDFADSTDLREIVAVNRQELLHKSADHHAVLQALSQERHQKEAEKRAIQANVDGLRQTVPLLEERARMKGGLAENGYVSRSEFLQVQQEYIDRRQELESASHKLVEADSAIAGIDDRSKQSEEQFRAEALSQLSEAEQKASSLAQDLRKAENRRGHYQLSAPVSGWVQQLAVHSVGAVVSQAEPVLMIVPDNEEVMVEAALPNKDAGFVMPGQAVEIKVAAFPFTRYGTIPGEVLTVSGDAVQSANNDPMQRRQLDGNGDSGRLGDSQGGVYSVRVKLRRIDIRADGRDVPLTAGMAVTAEIRTGRRRVIDYLFDPLLRYRDESFGER